VSGSPGPTPREWVGDRPYPWPPTLSLADLEDVVACFSIHSLTVGRTRNDAPFLRLVLADCYGTVEARMWDGVDAVIDALRPGMYVGVRGRLERYQEERQLRIEEIGTLSVELDDLVLFLPRSARPAEHMEAELTALIASLRDTGLRQLLQRMLAPGSDIGHAFRMAPAAKQNHHAYLGGLLEHTLSMAHVCDLLARHYGTAIDRDLLIAGALLHDVGKIREIGARAGFPYTDEGKLLGHILLGLQMVADAAAHVGDLSHARLLLLQHLIASHQGRYEWQSPREPRTLEALILHYADDLDAKLAQAGSLVNAVDGGWTAYDRSLGRDFLRHIRHGLPTPGTDTAADAAPADAPAVALEGAPGGQAPTQGELTDPQTRVDPGDGPPRRSPVLDTLDLFEES
jgi:3'-5' exoribonuclease